ncbi:MAG: T9SS type A sorting domain-containing protein [Bacteroidota bacterium]
MKNRKRLFLSVIAAVLLSMAGTNTAFSQPCTHSVVLYDSFGDGWTTSSTIPYHYLTVRVNGVAVLTNITLTTGVQSSPFTFSASTGDVISTTFTNNGLWSSECSYSIFNNTNTLLANTGPASLTSVAALCSVAPPAPSLCDFKVIMRDSFGDGWNGGYLRIYINGVLTYTNVTLPSGSGPANFLFTTSHGDVVRVTFVAGSWADECCYVIEQGGVQIFADGALYSYVAPTANNTLVGTGSCPVDLVVDEVLLDYADGYWARREAPDGNAVRAALTLTSGTGPSNVTAVYKLGSAPTSAVDGVVENFSGVVWNSGVAEIEFTQRLTNLMPGMNTVYVRVFASGDPDPTNDSYGEAFEVQTYEVQGYEDFEGFSAPTLEHDGIFDMGWTVTDVNGGSTWQTGLSGGDMTIMFPNGASADDWIFSPATTLEQNSSYRLQGAMRTLGASNKTLQLAYGLSPNPAAMTVFATFTGFSNTSFMEFKSIAGNLFDPYFNTTAGPVTIYIGIHLVSVASDAVLISYLSLNDNPTPPPVIGYALPGSSIGSYIDDPSIPIKISANYKAPGKINKTFSVANTTDMYGTNGDFLWDVETTTPWIAITKSTPEPTLQSYNTSPPRPRQFQTFTMTVDPAGMAPGVFTGELTFYGILFNDEFPPPASGLPAINEPFVVPVELRISTAGGKAGASSICSTIATPMTAGNTYPFADPSTGERIAEVQVTGGQIDNMTICAFPKQLPQNITRLRYIERYWQIQAVGSSWTADVTFAYSDQETSMISDLNQLRGVRQASPLGMWENPINGTSSVSTPIDNSVTVVGMNPTNYQGNIALGHPYVLGRSGDGIIPTELSLSQNFPNPFNPTTSISFGIPEEGSVRLRVFDLFGREVATLVNGNVQAGFHNAEFNGSDIASGTYVYLLEWNGTVLSHQMTLMK